MNEQLLYKFCDLLGCVGVSCLSVLLICVTALIVFYLRKVIRDICRFTQ